MYFYGEGPVVNKPAAASIYKEVADERNAQAQYTPSRSGMRQEMAYPPIKNVPKIVIYALHLLYKYMT